MWLFPDEQKEGDQGCLQTQESLGVGGPGLGGDEGPGLPREPGPKGCSAVPRAGGSCRGQAAEAEQCGGSPRRPGRG